jgi:hypothetical protein
MIPHSHPHAHGRDKAKQSHPTELWRGLHKDWRTWLVIGVMLAAIGTYILSLDDSIQPGGPAQNSIPAATAPKTPSK